MSGGDRHLGVGGKKGMEWRGNRVVEELMNLRGKELLYLCLAQST